MTNPRGNTNPLGALSGEGVAVWLDDISRERLRSGNLAKLITERNVVGVTSNPTIFEKALKEGDAYDAQLHDLALRDISVGEAVRAITGYDIRWAADVLRPLYDSSDRIDGRVSLEVDPSWRATPSAPSPRPAPCGGWSTGPT